MHPSPGRARDDRGDQGEGRTDEARDTLEEVLTIARRAEDPPSAGLALFGLGTNELDEGLFASAVATLSEGIALLESAGDRRYMGYAGAWRLGPHDV